uniref:Coatomer subunit zeta n=1 Tax=Salmo trutta TaxID=8032 RepID=A0A674ACV3_SALTR
MEEPSLYTVKAVLILDNDGERLYAKLMLMAVLNCLFDSLSQMLRKNVERRALLENMEGLFLAVDEIVDGGVILESDPQQVVHRVALRGEDVPYSEQTVTQVIAGCKNYLHWTFSSAGFAWVELWPAW